MNFKPTLRFCSTIAASFLLIGCNEYEKPLANDYRLIRMNGLEVCIAEPDNTISLEGNVERYSIQNPFIIGYASTNHMHANQGYFIINTRTHEMKQGLAEADWKAELKSVPWLSQKLERVP